MLLLPLLLMLLLLLLQVCWEPLSRWPFEKQSSRSSLFVFDEKTKANAK